MYSESLCCSPETISTLSTDYACTHAHSVVSDSVTPWTVACQAPLSIGFSWQEYWSGLPFPPPGDLPDPGIKLMSPALAGGFFTSEPPGKPVNLLMFYIVSM